MVLKLGFIGAGTVGTALAVRLSQQGYPVIAIHDLYPASAERFAGAVKGSKIYDRAQDVADIADFIFITTPDDFIAQVAAEVSWHAGQMVAHCSGAASTDVLTQARERGARVGCIHPLQTFASLEQAIENVPGSLFAIEAKEPVLSVLKEMATALKGTWLELTAEDKALYHAAACIACNYFYTLVSVASDLWQNWGKSSDEAIRAMMPMLQGALNNLKEVGLPNGATGPILRGDMVTLRKHLTALEKKAPDIIPLYKMMGTRTIPLALGKGTIDRQRADELRELLK